MILLPLFTDQAKGLPFIQNLKVTLKLFQKQTVILRQQKQAQKENMLRTLTRMLTPSVPALKRRRRKR